mgnify:CR=1 FL=1
MILALYLARLGLRPIVIERGQAVDDRIQTVEKFWNTGILDNQNDINEAPSQCKDKLLLELLLRMLCPNPNERITIEEALSYFESWMNKKGREGMCSVEELENYMCHHSVFNLPENISRPDEDFIFGEIEKVNQENDLNKHYEDALMKQMKEQNEVKLMKEEKIVAKKEEERLNLENFHIKIDLEGLFNRKEPQIPQKNFLPSSVEGNNQNYYKEINPSYCSTRSLTNIYSKNKINFHSALSSVCCINNLSLNNNTITQTFNQSLNQSFNPKKAYSGLLCQTKYSEVFLGQKRKYK